MKSTPIGIAELKAHCSKIVERVRKTRVSRVVTVRGKPAIELRAIEQDREPRLGGLAGTVKVVGDIVSAEDVEYNESTELFEV